MRTFSVIGAGNFGCQAIRACLEARLSNIAVIDTCREAIDIAKAKLIKMTSADSWLLAKILQINYQIVEETSDLSRIKNVGDIAWVCTPPDTHLGWTDALLKLGSHILLEKPMSSGVEGCEPIIETAKRENRVLRIDYCYPLHPIFDNIGSAITETIKKDGPIVVSMVFKKKPYEKTSWRKTEQGSPLYQLASHHLFLVLKWFGENYKIGEMIHNKKETSFTLDFENDILVRGSYADNAFSAGQYFNFNLAGKIIEINANSPEWIVTGDYPIDNTYGIRPTINFRQKAIKTFVDVIEERSPTSDLATGEEALAVQKMIEKISQAD